MENAPRQPLSLCTLEYTTLTASINLSDCVIDWFSKVEQILWVKLSFLLQTLKLKYSNYLFNFYFFVLRISPIESKNNRE